MEVDETLQRAANGHVTHATPTDTLCPVCSVTFQQRERKQGGGRRSIYCSARCRSTDWARGHGASRKATILKYEARPENKQRKKERTRSYTLKQYGLTEAAYAAMYTRQRGRCLIGQEPLDFTRPVVDHDHATGKVRGLLCRHCNWALGHVRDDRARLYQMAAYLELDRSKPVVYIIGSLQNDGVPVLGDSLRAAGYEAVDNWFAAGKEADRSWQEYSKGRGKTYAEALSSREANHTFFFDRSYINLSDAVVMLYPAGRSAHLEFGYAVGQGQRGYVLTSTAPERYDVMTQFATAVVQTEAELLAQLRADLPPTEGVA